MSEGLDAQLDIFIVGEYDVRRRTLSRILLVLTMEREAAERISSGDTFEVGAKRYVLSDRVINDEYNVTYLMTPKRER